MRKRITVFIKSNVWVIKKDIMVIFIFFFLTVFFYKRAWGGFFQGDEWFYFSQFLPLTYIQAGLQTALAKSLFSTTEISGGGHLTPLYTLIWFYHNRFFGLNFLPYISLSILFHALNGILLFYIVRKIAKNDLISFVSGVFFITSYQNFQAITWIMAYVPTVYALFFALVSFLFLIHALETAKKTRVYTWLSIIFFIFALLTKETSVVFFLIFPLTVFLLNKKLFRHFVYLYVLLFILYGAFRFGIPLLQKGSSLTRFSEIYTPELFIFRMITYPLKVLVGVFVPHEFILKVTEVLTPLAYPSYGAEKAVRGTNFLTFTQSAGSDLLIYPLSLALVITIVSFYLLFHKDRKIRYLLIIGFLIVISSAFPLLFIAFYASSWGYVTFIDSRHLYFPSIGASMMLSAIFFGIFQKRKNIPRFNEKSVLFLLLLVLIVWVGIQYTYLQKQLQKEELMGMQRRIVLNKILSSVPKLPKKVFFLIESNTGYYGFASIPPFQTHLGQILILQYYQRGQLPSVFVQDYSLSRKGLTAEGVLQYGDRQFGYFIDKYTFFTHLVDTKVALSSIYGFRWDGATNSLVDITRELRGKYNALAAQAKQYSNWKKIIWKDRNFQFSIPPDATLIVDSNVQDAILRKATIFIDTAVYELTLWKKTLNIGIFEDISYMRNSDGEMISDNFYYRDIPTLYGEKYLAKIPSQGSSMDYFLPTILPNTIIQVRRVGRESKIHSSDELVETFISLMKPLTSDE